MARGRGAALDKHITELVDAARKISISSDIAKLTPSALKSLDNIVRG
jgi:hypothetical protein